MAKFTELPGKVQIGIIVLVLAIISGALYWFVYQDMANKNTQMKATLKAKEDENNALRPYADKKADMERRIATLKDQLEQMKRIVPDEKEAPQFMEMMQAEARKAGIEIRRYESKQTTSKDYITEVPWDMDIDGPYYSVLRFFDSVAHLDRIVNVANVKMSTVKKPGDAGVRKTYAYQPTESVVANIQTTTFFSREQPAATAPAKK